MTTENYLGSDCTGSDGDLNRTLTILNSALTSDDNFYVFVDSSYFHLTRNYTVSHQSNNTVITFLNYLWDDQSISIQYSTRRASPSEGGSGVLPLDTQYINNELNYYGDTVTVRAVNKVDNDVRGNAQTVLGDSKIYNINGDDSNTAFYDSTWVAQTFTTSTTAVNVASLKLKLKRTGTPGEITVSIKAVDGNNKPTGSDLSSATFTVNDLIDDGDTEWTSFHLSSYILVASTTYAIVIRASEGDSSNKLDARTVTTGTYAGGNILTSNDSGSSWTAGSPDILFDLYGDTTAVAMVDVLNQDDDPVKFGQFQSGDKRFFFQNSESNIARGTQLQHNSLWYEIDEVIETSAGDVDYWLEAIAKKI